MTGSALAPARRSSRKGNIDQGFAPTPPASGLAPLPPLGTTTWRRQPHVSRRNRRQAAAQRAPQVARQLHRRQVFQGNLTRRPNQGTLESPTPLTDENCHAGSGCPAGADFRPSAAGEDLSFSIEFDRIQEARRSDDPTLDQGEWQTDIKYADWSSVARQCGDLLQTRTKDLRLAGWMTEATTQIDASPGWRWVTG